VQALTLRGPDAKSLVERVCTKWVPGAGLHKFLLLLARIRFAGTSSP